MSTTTQPASSPYLPVRDDWLARRTEAILEPGLPIVDPHHHLWDRPGWRYLLDDLLADTNSGHNIVATVFVQCRAMHRAGGPEEMRPVGETEFVNGVAAMSASGGYGKTKVCAGIVGHADLRLGARVQAVLEAHIRAGGGRFRGIRHITAWDADPTLMNPAYAPPPGLMADATFREGFARLAPLNLTFDAWLYHPQIDELTALAQAFPDTRIVPEPCRRAARDRRLWRQARRGVREMVGVDPRAGEVPERGGEARRHGDADQRLRFPREGRSAVVGGAGRGVEALCRDVHRGVRRGARHVREQLPGGQGIVQLCAVLERVQDPGARRERGGEERPVQRHGGTVLPVGAIMKPRMNTDFDLCSHFLVPEQARNGRKGAMLVPGQAADNSRR